MMYQEHLYYALLASSRGLAECRRYMGQNVRVVVVERTSVFGEYQVLEFHTGPSFSGMIGHLNHPLYWKATTRELIDRLHKIGFTEFEGWHPLRDVLEVQQPIEVTLMGDTNDTTEAEPKADYPESGAD